ncbi:MAG: alpha/beta hydrolase [Spirochaetaceae bacterium]|nr:alpha/beta hydrolase [Spirochaetaceae bacterium]HPG28351.1 alpha/beta hydrolase [Myxococcota bacterium]
MPHIVLVHGAFHGPWCFEPLIAPLRERGLTATTPELPLTSLEEDVAAVRRVLDLLAADRAARGDEAPVLLLGHSYGGAVISAAGEHPLVGRLVLLCALAPDDGEAPNGGPVEIDAPFLAALRGRDDGTLEVDAALAGPLFYPDASPAAAAEAVSKLRAGVTGRPGERIERTAWRRRPTDYVVCAADPILLPQSQRALAARTGAKVHEIPGDHSPFLARPEMLADLLARIAGSA